MCVYIYKRLQWGLLQDWIIGMQSNFNENQFYEIINNIYTNSLYTSYNQFVYEINDENINRKKISRREQESNYG